MTPEQLASEKRYLEGRLKEAPVNSPKYKKLMRKLILLKMSAGELKMKAGSKLS
jgi:hypothetical protein